MEEKIIGMLLVVLLALGGLALHQDLLNLDGENQAEVQTVQVKSVTDGDTIKVLMDGEKETVRILGIDTPEPYASVNITEWEGISDEEWLRTWGHRASNFTKRWMTDEVDLIFDSSAGKRGSFDRLLAYVELPNGTEIGEELLKRGVARAYTASDCDRKDHYVNIEEDARDSGIGVWGGAALQTLRGMDVNEDITSIRYHERMTITA